MRLGALKRTRKKDEVFKLSEKLTTELIMLLSRATNNGGLRWEEAGPNMFSATIYHSSVVLDQPNNEPASLHYEDICIQDDGSGSYGFNELIASIQKQKEEIDLRFRLRFRPSSQMRDN